MGVHHPKTDSIPMAKAFGESTTPAIAGTPCAPAGIHLARGRFDEGWTSIDGEQYGRVPL